MVLFQIINYHRSKAELRACACTRSVGFMLITEHPFLAHRPAAITRKRDINCCISRIYYQYIALLGLSQ